MIAQKVTLKERPHQSKITLVWLSLKGVDREKGGCMEEKLIPWLTFSHFDMDTKL